MSCKDPRVRRGQGYRYGPAQEPHQYVNAHRLIKILPGHLLHLVGTSPYVEDPLCHP